MGQNLENPEEQCGNRAPLPSFFPNKVLTSVLRCLGAHRLREEAVKVGTRLSGPLAASRNLTPSVQPPICPSVCPFRLCPHPIRSTISHCPNLSPIVEQQGPFLYPVGNGNKMSTAGDVGYRTGWHTSPEKGPGWGWV
ncbi:hypothetical protein HJG60_009298 [Phyllostomus discolor]|uniref:Uncharacterized protein n=1 Tax=Phyllostomus discolor TaxID=89673 RepID=A0A834D8N2_9CHIR|nr:hypothetical protein HJG60_009298 [Phyllostomus discolor]